MIIYLLTINNQVGYDFGMIHQYVTTLSGVTDWWHYLPTSYLLCTTGRSARGITEEILRRFPNLTHLIVQVNMRDNNGLLQKEAWDWINSKNNQNTPLKPMSTLPTIPQIKPYAPAKSLSQILGVDLSNLK